MPISLFLQTSAPNQLMGMLPFVLILGIFYFLLFLPMQRQKKQHQKMLSELAPGDTVITNGGIVGGVVSIADDDTMVIRVKPDNLKIQVTKAAVQSRVTTESKKA